MFCMKCGTKLPEDALFCMKCGAKLPVMMDVSADTSTDEVSLSSTDFFDQSSEIDIYEYIPRNVNERLNYIRACIKNLDNVEMVQLPEVLIIKISNDIPSLSKYKFYLVPLTSEKSWERVPYEKRASYKEISLSRVLHCFLAGANLCEEHVYWVGATPDGHVCALVGTDNEQNQQMLVYNAEGKSISSDVGYKCLVLNNQTIRMIVETKENDYTCSYLFEENGSYVADFAGCFCSKENIATRYALLTIREVNGDIYDRIINLETGKSIASVSDFWGGTFYFSETEPFDEVFVGAKRCFDANGHRDLTQNVIVRLETGQILSQMQEKNGFVLLKDKLVKNKYFSDTYKKKISKYLVKEVAYTCNPIL